MEAYKCDMCGTLYEAYDKNKKPYYMKINIAKNTAWEQHVRHIDLCEKCYDKVLDMIKYKRSIYE